MSWLKNLRQIQYKKTQNRYKRVEKWIMWKSPLTKWICLMLLVKDGHRPFQIILKPGFQLSVLDVRLRRIIVISVNTKLGSFEEQSVFSVVWSVFFFFTSYKQALGERYGRKRSRSCSFACFEEHCTGWSCIFQNVCIDQIKRGISLVKVSLTCKNHATFLDNSELFIARAFSISGV